MLPSARPTAKRVSSGENASAVTPCGIQSMNLHRCTSRCLLMAREREIESSEQVQQRRGDERKRPKPEARGVLECKREKWRRESRVRRVKPRATGIWACGRWILRFMATVERVQRRLSAKVRFYEKHRSRACAAEREVSRARSLSCLVSLSLADLPLSLSPYRWARLCVSSLHTEIQLW